MKTALEGFKQLQKQSVAPDVALELQKKYHQNSPNHTIQLGKRWRRRLSVYGVDGSFRTLA